MSKIQNNIASCILIAGVLTFALASTSVEASKPTCQEKCASVWSPKLQACKEVQECVEYVEREYNVCIKRCASKE